MSETIAKLKGLLELLQNDTITPKELKQFLVAVINAVNVAKRDLQSLSQENLDTIEAAAIYIVREHDALLAKVDLATEARKAEFATKIAEANALIAEVKAIEVHDGEPGKDADEELIVARVLDRIPPAESITGESIVDKINALPLDEEFQIDASHIKNLPKTKQGHSGGVVARMVYQLGDVSLVNLADGDSLVWNDTTKLWENGPVSGTVTTIVGITGTKAEYNTSLTDGDFLFVGDITQYTDELAQDAVGTIFADTDTINATYTDNTPEIKFDVRTQMSITSDASGIKLSGDAATPGNSKYYGTNGAGAKGFFDLPGGGTGITRTITVSSGAFTAGSTAGVDYVYLVAGAHAVALPTAVGNTNRYTFKNNHSAAITITPDGAETVEGGATIQIAPEDSVDLISNNSNWFVI